MRLLGPRGGRRATAPAVVAAVAVASAVAWWTVRHGSHIDTAAFRESVHAALRGDSPYFLSTSVPFVYPPPALLVIVLSAVGPNVPVASIIWTVVTLACLARVTWLLVGLAWPTSAHERRVQLTCGLFGVACLMEPSVRALEYGQLGLILLWLTVEGLHGQPRSSPRPLLVGLAAAVKLTPSIVLVGLAAAGRWRSAGWGLIGFIGAWVGAAIVAPAALRDYVRAGWRLASDVNATPDVLNHSLIGVCSAAGLPAWAGIAGAAVTLIAGVALTAALWRSDDELGGLATVLITGLLVSPVSWAHHWVACYPALVLLAREARTRRVSAVALITVAVIGMLVQIDEIALPASRILGPGEAWTLTFRAWYVAWGLAFLCWVALRVLPPIRRPEPQPANRDERQPALP